MLLHVSTLKLGGHVHIMKPNVTDPAKLKSSLATLIYSAPVAIETEIIATREGLEWRKQLKICTDFLPKDSSQESLSSSPEKSSKDSSTDVPPLLKQKELQCQK